HAQALRGRSLSWKLRLSNFGGDGKARIDDVRNLVLERLSHERRSAAFREPMIGHEPALHFARGMLQRFEQRPGAPEDDEMRVRFKARPADGLAFDEID